MPRTSLCRAAVVLLTLVVAACAEDADPDSSPEGSTPASTTLVLATTADTTAPKPPTSSSPSTTNAAPELADTIAVAELGYPRDLLDRGRVNIVITRDGDEPWVLVEHQLRTEGFTPAPAEERRIVIPGNGQRVAIQALFGDPVDCDAPTPLAASLAVRYTFGDDVGVREGTIQLDETSTLAEIRSRYCTARQVFADNDVTLGEPILDGETFSVDLGIVRRTGDAELAVHAVQGTVLFGVETPHQQGAPERTLASGVGELVLPLTFDVNRCDPHAVAETTRKKGLTLWVAVDGATPQPVDVDISAIDDELEEILERCKARTGQ